MIKIQLPTKAFRILLENDASIRLLKDKLGPTQSHILNTLISDLWHKCKDKKEIAKFKTHLDDLKKNRVRK